ETPNEHESETPNEHESETPNEHESETPNEHESETPNEHETPVDPGPGTITWCTPQAVSAVPSINLPEIPPEVFDPECPLVEETIENHDAYYPDSSRVRYYHREDGVWARYSSASFADLLHVVMDGGARVEARYGRRFPGDDLRFDFREAIYRFTWDRAGHLLQSSVILGETEEVHLTQTWQGDRLVARTEMRSHWNGSETVLEPLATAWQYDDAGRLVGATATGLGRTWRVAWSYDAHGRPTAVERLRDDVRVEHRTWTYDEAGRVARRTILDDRTDENQIGFGPRSLDDLGAASTYDWRQNPWPRSLPVFDAARACTHLPTSLGHGYPTDEPEYDLGTPVAERPSGIGWAYGNNSYGWDYGDLAWYSHGGIHGLSIEDRGIERLEATITYEDGRMVSESLVDGSTWAGTRRFERARTFTDGRLSKDRLDLHVTFTSTDADGVEVVHEGDYGRELTFARSGAGHLVARELHDDVFGLLERQTWTHDAEGRWLAHEVSKPSPRAQIPDYYWSDPASCEGCPSGAPVMWRRYERELDAAGRTTMLLEMYIEPGVPSSAQETRYTFDTAGRLIERRHGGGYRELWDYDAQGRLVREAWDHDGDGVIEQWEETTWDAWGRWVRRQYFYGADQPGRALVRTYACGPSEG
ncbi:MAG: hypothetical protein IT385_24020, partial [Deltaproteobacteria bacterium]|nr:hypothetical protein [Deltaproteobacteria bacterium]